MATLFSLENQEVVRIKVKKCDGLLQPEYKKLCVDPQITSFDMLQRLLAKAFNIKMGEFTISYLARDDYGQEMYLSLLSDWDIDAAFLSASKDPYLRLKVDLRPFEETLEDWDVVPPGDYNSHHAAARGLGTTFLDKTLLGSITGTISSQVGKTVSHMTRAMGLRLEERAMGVGPTRTQPAKPPMSDAEFHGFLDSVGHLVQPQQFRLNVYQGGVEPALRRVVWRHLLNVYPEGLSGRERFEYMKSKVNEYYRLREQWRDVASQGGGTEVIRAVTSMVKKDVLRTDRMHSYFEGSDDNQNVVSLFNLLVTFALTHPEVSYCQGMSDIASPILVVQNDEAHAYICFCGAMKRLQANFMLDGEAMTAKFSHLAIFLEHQDPVFHAYLKDQHAHDMFFCYRWLLLEMKREFALEDAMYMLEVMWSSLPPDPPELEIELVAPVYKEHGLQAYARPAASNVYMSLMSRRQRNSLVPNDIPPTKDSSLKGNGIEAPAATTAVAITPCEDAKTINPKDFESVTDEATEGLQHTSGLIDKSLESSGGENGGDVLTVKTNRDSTTMNGALTPDSLDDETETDTRTSHQPTSVEVGDTDDSSSLQSTQISSSIDLKVEDSADSPGKGTDNGDASTRQSTCNNIRRPSDISLRTSYKSSESSTPPPADGLAVQPDAKKKKVPTATLR